METFRETESPAVFELHHQASATERPLDVVQEKALLDIPLLRQNVVWFQQLRWIVVLLFLIGAIGGSFPSWLKPLGLSLDSGWLLAAAVVLATANVVYRWLTPPDDRPFRAAWLRLHLWTQIILDLLVLTVVVHQVGSVTTFAPFMYLFHIILACIFFSPRESLAVTIIAGILYAGCAALEWSGVIDPATVFIHSRQTDPTNAAVAFWMWRIIFALTIWSIIWYLASRLADALREREQRLAMAHVQLKSSSRERTRHMLQTTHQLKAPFAAIHANAQMLLRGHCGQLPANANEVAEKITTRCHAISQQITEMLQLANLRSTGQDKPPMTDLDLYQIVQLAVERITPAAARRDVRIEIDVAPVAVRGIEDHLRMLVDNLLSNAVNYSYDGGVVTVSCHDAGKSSTWCMDNSFASQCDKPIKENQAILEVRDRGIGIPPDKLPHIFEDHYRTREAAHHNQLSTGLGLAIVRDVARAAGIDVTVQSDPGWGTCFTVTIPKNKPQFETRPKQVAEGPEHAISPIS